MTNISLDGKQNADRVADGANQLLDAALDYGRRGFLIIPLHNPTHTGCSCGKAGCSSPAKHPRIKDWPNQATTDAGQIRKWFDKWPQMNIGIVTDGLVVLDVDYQHGGRESLAALVTQHGPLPSTLTANTGRGHHEYFKSPEGSIVRNSAGKLGPGLDIRAEGGFVVAPGSVHHTGVEYAWEDGSGPNDVGLSAAPDWLVETVTEQAEQTEAIGCSICSVTSDDDCSTCSVTFGDPCSVTEMIDRTMPRASGQRNKCIWRFARLLKSIPTYADLPVAELKPFIRQWFDRAKAIISTQDFSATWFDFSYAWGRIKFPAGTSPAELAMRKADISDDPLSCRDYSDNLPMRRLIKLCRELQKVNGSQPFYLSCELAGSLLSLERQTAWRYLKLLVVDGILTVAIKGNAHKATRYQYVAAEMVESMREAA